MALPARDDEFRQFLRLLAGHPEWQAELRRHVLTEELLQLPEVVARLAQSQAQSQERLETRLKASEEQWARIETQIAQLVAAQLRAEERLGHVEEQLGRVDEQIAQLVAAQLRAEERLGHVEDRLSGVEDRQREVEERLSRVDEQIAELVAAQLRAERRLSRLDKQVGTLAEGVGGRNELEGERVLLAQLEAHGYQLAGRPRPVAVNGEVDTVVPVQRAGEQAWVLLSAKTRLRRGDVWGWQRRFSPELLARLRHAGVGPPFLLYAFGLRVYDDAVQAGQATGIGILDPYGEVVGPTLRPA